MIRINAYAAHPAGALRQRDRLRRLIHGDGGAADGVAHVAGREDGGALGPRGIGVGATVSS